MFNRVICLCLFLFFNVDVAFSQENADVFSATVPRNTEISMTANTLSIVFPDEKSLENFRVEKLESTVDFGVFEGVGALIGEMHFECDCVVHMVEASDTKNLTVFKRRVLFRGAVDDYFSYLGGFTPNFVKGNLSFPRKPSVEGLPPIIEDVSTPEFEPHAAFEGQNLVVQIREDILTRKLFADLDSLALSNNNEVEEAQEPSSADEEQQFVLRSSGLVLDNTSIQVASDVADSQFSCEPFRQIVPGKWSHGIGFPDGLAEVRRGLGSLDAQIDQSDFRNLALAYLSLGWGAEAALSLRTVYGDEAELSALLGVAAILDGGEDSSFLPDRAVEGCSDTAMWAAALGRTSRATALSEARIQFAAAPQGVQSAIGARLAESFISVGELDAARFVLETIEDLPEIQTGEVALLQSELSKAMGFEKQAEELLMDTIDADNDASAQALSQAILSEETIASIDVDESEALLEVYRTEYSGTDVELDLLRAQVRASIVQSEYRNALTLLKELDTLDRPSSVEAFLDQFAKRVLEDPSPSQFLATVLAIPNNLYRRISPQLQASLAERFEEERMAGLAANLGAFADRDVAQEDMENLGETASEVLEPTLDDPSVPVGTAEASQLAEPETLQAQNPLSPRDTEQDQVAFPEAGGELSTAVSSTIQVLDTLDDLNSAIEDLGL